MSSAAHEPKTTPNQKKPLGFLQKLFATPEPHIFVLPGNGEYKLELVGESFYQDNLITICGPYDNSVEQKRIEAEATLILEDDNKYDRNNAVRVEIQGKPVGYLKKEVARAYRGVIKEGGHPRAIGKCQAIIQGGWDRSEKGRKDVGMYGVRLDIPIEFE